MRQLAVWILMRIHNLTGDMIGEARYEDCTCYIDGFNDAQLSVGEWSGGIVADGHV